MKHVDFKVGEEFRCGDRTWLCTDVGTRIVIAICRAPLCRRNDWGRSIPDDVLGAPGKEVADRIDLSWLKGPPYALAEHVFGENDMPGCERNNDYA